MKKWVYTAEIFTAIKETQPGLEACLLLLSCTDSLEGVFIPKMEHETTRAVTFRFYEYTVLIWFSTEIM